MGIERDREEGSRAAFLDRALGWLGYAVAAGAGLRFGSVVIAHLSDRGDLIFETPHLATIEVLKSGLNPYDPAVYAQFPFVFTLYTPLYYLVSAPLPIVDDHPFLGLRLVALVAMIAALGAVAWSHRSDAARWLPALGVAALLLVRPVTLMTAYSRPDIVGVALSVLSVAWLSARPERPVGPAILAVFAFWSKQPMLSASLAGFAGTFALGRRSFLPWSATWTGVFLLTAIAAHVLWGPGLWWCTLVAPRYGALSAPLFFANIREVASQPALVALVVLGIAAGLAHLKQERLGRGVLTAPFVYMLAAWAAFFVMIGKEGAANNYVLEPAFATSLWLSRFASARVVRSRWGRIGVASLIACAAVELVIAPVDTYAFSDATRRGERAEMQREVKAEVAPFRSEHGYVFNPFVHQLSTLIGAPPAFSDATIYHRLWRDGHLDDAPILEALADHRFDVVMLPEPDALPGYFRNFRWDEWVVSAILEHYMVARQVDSYTLLVPDEARIVPP